MCNNDAHSLEELNKITFSEFTAHDRALVLFTIVTCPFGRKQRRVLSDLVPDYPSFFISAIDAHVCPDVSIKYNVHVTPTLLFFRKGKLADRVSGLRERDEIEELFSSWYTNERGSSAY